MEWLTVKKPRALLLMGLTILVCLGLTLAEARAADSEPVARYGPVKVTDTLWTIASRYRPEPELSVQQTMLAIVALNPAAFRDGNIHHMYTGYYLDIPPAEVIARMDETQARDLIDQQRHDGPGLASTDLTQLQETAGAVSAEDTSRSGPPADEQQSDATEAALAEAEEAAAQVAELRQELSLASQAAERLDQENQELQQQLRDLNELVEELREEAAAAEALGTELEQLRADQRGQNQEQAIGAVVLKWLSWPWVAIPATVLLVVLLGLWRALRSQQQRAADGHSPYEVATAHSREEQGGEAAASEQTMAEPAVPEQPTDSAELTEAQESLTEQPIDDPTADEQSAVTETDETTDGEQERAFRDIDEILAEAETEVAEDDDPDDLNEAGGQTTAERLAAELDLARAYLEMEEIDDAREVLTQVHEEAQAAAEHDLADDAATLLRRLDDA